MCVVIDTCCLPAVFDGGSAKHNCFVPVLNWINGKGRVIYGGTKYNQELGKAPKYLGYLAELSRSNHTVRISDSTVDLIAAELKVKYPDPKFNDEHIVALVIASRCRVVCTDDKEAAVYLRRADLFRAHGVSRPSIYRGHKSHGKLCCDEKMADICRR